MEVRDPTVFVPGPDATGLYNLYGVTPWKNLTLATGWSNAVGNATAQYRLTPGGRVVCKGLIQQTVLLTAGSLLATFPAGYRPLEQRTIYTAVATTVSVGLQKLTLATNGQLTYQGTSISLTTVQISLEGLEFDAEQ